MSDWITDYYADVDGMNLQAFVGRHTDDAELVFGNNPPAVGKEAIGASIGELWSSIAGMRHERRHVWLVDDGATAVCEFVTHYTTKGGAHVPVRCVSLLDRTDDGRVRSLRVHIDPTPLFAQLAAESVPEQVIG